MKTKIIDGDLIIVPSKRYGRDQGKLRVDYVKGKFWANTTLIKMVGTTMAFKRSKSGIVTVVPETEEGYEAKKYTKEAGWQFNDKGLASFFQKWFNTEEDEVTHFSVTQTDNGFEINKL